MIAQSSSIFDKLPSKPIHRIYNPYSLPTSTSIPHSYTAISINLISFQSNIPAMYLFIIIPRMSLKKYPACDESHSADFEYVCLKQKRVFCVKCWFKCEHYRHCLSTRCGQYTKIAHLALNRALEFKNSKLLEQMTSSGPSYESYRLKFLQLNYQISDIVKDFVEQKMPLLLWGMTNQLLKAKMGAEEILGYSKFDGTCSEMLRIIKSNGQNKQEFLESAISAYYEINHHIEGELYLVKNGGFVKKGNREEQVTQVLDKIKSQLQEMMKNIKKGVRTAIDEELKKTTEAIDPSCKFKGVSFQKSGLDGDNFRKKQEYPFLNLLSQQYGRITNEQNDLYNGFHLSLPELESTPEQLLQLSKCFIKQRLHSYYESIACRKSLFPYKYTYPIATTLSNDRDYEQLVVDIERAVIDSPDKVNPFLNSLTLLVMGRELIVVRFYNHPKFCYSRKIYNYRREREAYYDSLTDRLALRSVPVRSAASPENFEYGEELTDAELVYCNFQIAYESVFLVGSGDELVFEGERVMANRGAEQMAHLMERWRSTTQIDMQFSRPQSEMLKFFV